MDDALLTIKKLKHKPFGSVTIEEFLGGESLALILLTKDSLEDKKIVPLLAKWRKKHEFWFPTQFPVTLERTQAWLKDRVIAVPDRLLFMIRVKGAYIGHIGFFRFDLLQRSCEIDNIVRGEPGFPGLMTHAVTTMMAWGRNTLGLTNYSLQTTSDNARALRFYERLGFHETKRVPLMYTKTAGGGVWVEAPNDYKGNIARYDVYMSL